MTNYDVAPVAKTLNELTGLVENLLLLLSDKEKSVIKKRFALSGQKKHTLEEIGQDFSVTRERIRQIEKNALNKMKRNVFNTALRDLHHFVLGMVKKNGGLVRKDILINELVALLPKRDVVDTNSLDLSLVLHEDLECVGNTINFYPYVREKSVADYSLKNVSNHLVNKLHKHGDVRSLIKIHDELKDVLTNAEFDLLKVKSLVDIDKRLTLLDEDAVGLIEWRHIHPRTLRDKILYILRNEGKSLHFVEIAKRISDAAFDNREVNLQAVHNELIRHDHFVLVGRGIYALSEWGFERGTVAEVIEKVLEEKKELSQEEIIDQVLKQRQVKKITIVLALKNHSKFLRVGRKRYKLKS